MRKIILLIFLAFPALYGQESFLEKIDFGIQGKYVKIESDLGKYWGNTYSAGMYLKYIHTDNFGYLVSVNYSKLSEGKKAGNLLPGIKMISIPVLAYLISPLSEKFELNTYAGIENVMMIFDETETQKSNLTESEFAAVLSIGLNYKPFDIEIFGKYKIMFSAPENTPFYSLGLRKRVF